MRMIARLDIKNNFVIKGIHLEGLRKVGDPYELAMKYYRSGVDEILLMDAVASLYDRNNIFPVLKKASEDVFVPITIGGGLRNLTDVEEALKAGADKVAINTAAIREPTLIEKVARKYGSQSVVASIEAKQTTNGWEAYTESGREKSGIDALEWAEQLQDLGAGELLVTSIDKEGTKAGFDIKLIKAVNDIVSIPVVASGGYGEPEHIKELLKISQPSALCFASVLHYDIASIKDLQNVIEQSKSNE